MATRSALFVVDADLARACSASARPPAPSCMRFLDALLDICHRVVVSDELMEEWRRHSRRNVAFSRWLHRMFGRRKVERSGSANDGRLVSRIETMKASDGEKAEMLKDLHLVVVAIAHHAHIASMDEKARRRFERLAGQDERIGGITWVNPSEALDPLLEWLHQGALPAAEWSLGRSAGQRR